MSNGLVTSGKPVASDPQTISPAFRSTKMSRRRILQAGGAGLLTFGVASLLAACGVPNKADKAKKASALTVGVYQEPDSLDPGSTKLAMVAMVVAHMFDPLMWWLPNGSGVNEFHPGLATSYEVSKDATVYTFKLRKDVEFHDGTHFDANAVKATFDHIVNPETKAGSAKGGLGPYKETIVVDPYTVQIVFSAANAAFEHNMTQSIFGIQSPAALAKYGAAGIAAHPTGTGPFKFVGYATQDNISLERNPKYLWGPPAFGKAGPPSLKTLDFKILLDTNARYNALRSGQIQMAMNLDVDTIAIIKKSRQYAHYNVPSSGQPYGFPINVDKGPTDDLRVRQAIMYAVDQKKLNESVLRGAYTPAYNIVTPSTPGYVKANDTMYAYNPEKAKRLLDAAGWVVGADGMRSKGGQPLSLYILIQSANGFDLATQYVANALKQVGFATKTDSQPFSTAAASYNQGVQNFAAIFYYSPDPFVLRSLVTTSQIKSGFNWSHYSNPEVDSGIDAANAIANTSSRSAAYGEITTTLMKAAIFLPLWNVSGVYSGTSNLKNVHFGSTGYSYYHTANFS